MPFDRAMHPLLPAIEKNSRLLLGLKPYAFNQSLRGALTLTNTPNICIGLTQTLCRCDTRLLASIQVFNFGFLLKSLYESICSFVYLSLTETEEIAREDNRGYLYWLLLPWEGGIIL